MKSFFAVIFIILIGLGLYTATIRGVYGNPQPETIKAELEGPAKPFELSPERGRFAHVMALSQTGQYALTDKLGDFVSPDVGYYGGKFFSFFAPGISYMALPFYNFGAQYNLAQVAAFSLISLAAIGSLIFVFLICRNVLKLPVSASILAVLIFGFGSTAWSYSITLYQHLLTVFFSLSGFYAIWKFKQSGAWGWPYMAWAWLAYALAIFIDYPNALLLLPVMIYALVVSFNVSKDDQKVRVKFRPAIVLTFVVFLFITGLHFYHNQTYFGSWKRLSGSLVGIKVLQTKNLIGKEPAEIDRAIADDAAKKANVVKVFSEEKIPNSPGTLLFSKDRGLFFYAPIFIFAILGLLLALKKSRNLEIGILLGLVGANLFLYSSWGDPWGGWAYGPRYLIPSMAILSMFIAYWLANQQKWVWLKKFLVFILLAYSSAVALLGALTTNAVPPRVEADYLHLKYNFFYNLDLLKSNTSGSFIYNTYFKAHYTLYEYGLVIYTFLMLIFLIVLFILPAFKSKDIDSG